MSEKQRSEYYRQSGWEYDWSAWFPHMTMTWEGEASAGSPAGHFQAEEWLSSEKYYILKAFLFSFCREFLNHGTKEGKKGMPFLWNIDFFYKDHPLPKPWKLQTAWRRSQNPWVEDAVILKAATGYKLLEGPGAQGLFIFIYNKLNEKWERTMKI